MKPTPFEEKRLGRVLLSEAFVTGRAVETEFFKDFAILLAMPRYNEPGIIAYYAAHPCFEPYDGAPKNSPYYQPYWNDDGLYFKPVTEDARPDAFTTWMYELDQLFQAEFGSSHVDFDDYNWNDEFDSEVDPKDAFEEWQCMTDNGRNAVAGM